MTAKLTLQKRVKFLEVVAGGGTVKDGAAKIGVSRQALYQARDNDEGFRKSWEMAYEDGTEVLEKEAHRRAVEGVEKPVYVKGEIVDTVYEYSDTLLIFLLKARNPKKYRENVKHELSGPNDKPIAIRREDDFDFTEFNDLFRGVFQSPGISEQIPNGHSLN